MEDEERLEDINELIARSSLGTPEATAIRAATPLWVRRQIEAQPAREIAVVMVPKRSRWRMWPSKFLWGLQDFYSRIV